MTEDKERSFGREHVHLYACHLDNAMSPDAGSIDDDSAMCLAFFACVIVAKVHTFHATVVDDESYNFMIGKDFRSMTACIEDVCRCKMERINGSVGHAHSANKVRVDRWLYASCLCR